MTELLLSLSTACELLPASPGDSPGALEEASLPHSVATADRPKGRRFPFESTVRNPLP